MRTIPCAGRREGRVSDFQATHVRRSQRARRPQLQAWILHIEKLLLNFLHLQRYVENGGGSHDTTGPRMPHILYFRLSFFVLFTNFLFSAENARHHKNAVVHQGGSAGHNLNLKSLSSVLSTTCTNLERRIVVFSNPIFRWPNFLNVPKPTDSPL